MIDAGIDAAFVHAPTAVHFDTIKQLLEASIHVYVDKPISDQIAETEALVALAKEKNLILTCGFNRRFAPHVQALKAIPDKKMILIQKDRVQNFEDVRFAIYDLFIHILDAGLFLLDDPIESTHSTIIEKRGAVKADCFNDSNKRNDLSRCYELRSWR
ncbi:Gfo/Idh/MocA family protein [Jeotgalibaca sp. PTS2502]|uniref:Gfo/Idh/MocA family protein n=1 Tax=Jeotgalibaca sp. PTS2502 TaxID=1903686 RepID=UPI0018DD662A|nr:Gfo/Idh/MocA family oxidoreductase [Jeotgalibaca sp. PTS2502]